MLDAGEHGDLLTVAPAAEKFVKRYVGSTEFINDIERYCMWITDRELGEAQAIAPIAKRLEAVAQWRSESVAATTANYAAFPNRFKQISYRPTESIIVPRVSSERREYIPIGFLDTDTIISDLANAVYAAEPWLFSLLTSRMHNIWTRAVAGQLETRIRYGAYIVYNNFPVPPLSDAVKERLTAAALRVLDVREYHCERTLAELYDPDLMPADLRAAHSEVDALVDSIYSKHGYELDEQRLSDLFAMYEAMTEAEASKGSKE
ncbi:type IIL restriction-modification enzyme MmeI [Kocuria sp. CCUG 69068]|uniref:type IIL restriction-modification enzyme MmeI n=1 Tax=Kocuria sp. CCUG 69068 TaxID=2043138 RepID=UPI001E2C04E5